MTLKAHILAVLASIVMLGFVISSVRKRRLKSTYSMLWLMIGLVMVLLAIFPGLLTHTSHWVGIYYPPAAVLALAVTFLFVVVVHYSSELSRLMERTRTLAEEVALLRAEHERLATRIADASTTSASLRSPTPTRHHDEPVGGVGPSEPPEEALDG